MKKKIFLVFLVMLITVSTVACSSNKSYKKWEEKDFSFYDETGEEVAFAAPGETIYLEDINSEKGGDFQTLRGIKIGMRATKALENYDNVFYWFIMRNRSNTLEEEQEDQELLEKYGDIHDLVEASPDFLKSDEQLILNTIFHVSDDGSLIQCKMVDGRCDDEMDIWELESYEMEIEIQNEKIISLSVSHHESPLEGWG